MNGARPAEGPAGEGPARRAADRRDPSATTARRGQPDHDAGAEAGTGRARPPASAADLDPQSDQWLVDKARSGDPLAWEVLIRRHRDRIYRIALRMVGDPDDAEDVAQDVAVQLLTALAGFTGGSTFTTWLYRIVINRSLNHQRRRRRTRPLLDADHPTARGPEQVVLDRSRMEATATALTQLPGPLRTALVLHEMEGLSYLEVAAILDVPEPTVRGRIYRARQTLLDGLREWS